MRPSPVYCETGGVNMNDYLIEDELLRDRYPVYCETGGVNMNDYLIEDELL